MSTKTSGSTKAAARAAATARLAAGRFAQLLYGSIAILVLAAGALTAANVAQLPRVNSVSLVDQLSTPPHFALYSLQRDDRMDSAGNKKPDTIRGERLTGHGAGTAVVSAPRIQEFVALPNALALVTLNDDNSTSLEIVSLSGGAPVAVPLPKPGIVENLHASGSKHLISYSFTSAPISAGYWKTLFVYDPTNQTIAPRTILGIDGLPISVFNLAFVPGTTSLVAQTDDHSTYLVDALGAGQVTPLGLHAEIRNFIPGSQQLFVADRTETSTIDLASGKAAALVLPENVRSGTSFAGQTILLDKDGRYAQVVSEYTAGSESSVITVTDQTGSKTLWRPAAGWSRIPNFCLSPNGKYLAVETTSPISDSDQYPNLPSDTPMETVLVDLHSGASTGSFPGFQSSWCR
jgi:hypothetical protein